MLPGGVVPSVVFLVLYVWLVLECVLCLSSRGLVLYMSFCRYHCGVGADHVHAIVTKEAFFLSDLRNA